MLWQQCKKQLEQLVFLPSAVLATDEWMLYWDRVVRAKWFYKYIDGFHEGLCRKFYHYFCLEKDMPLVSSRTKLLYTSSFDLPCLWRLPVTPNYATEQGNAVMQGHGRQQQQWPEQTHFPYNNIQVQMWITLKAEKFDTLSLVLGLFCKKSFVFLTLKDF